MAFLKDNINSIVCCGCGACQLICPTSCISIDQNEEGFWQATCEDKNCINCGKCKKICPMNEKPKCNKPFKQYAAVAISKHIYNMGASGGIFPLVAVKTIREKGYVWACGYDNNVVPMHKEIDSENNLDDLCRSKYVQSYTAGVYEKVKKRLDNGDKVLFVGTPCQVAGVRKYLDIEYPNLTLIDVICHGVPSPHFFAENIEQVSNKRHKKIARLEFRLKQKETLRRSTYSYTYIFLDGSIETGPYYKDLFFNTFYDMTSLNESCYICPYACPERAGDLTIGDFEWGKVYHQEFEEYDAISCILINTEKGERLFNDINSDLKYSPTKWENITEKNLNLVRPTVRPSYRNKIYREIKSLGYTKWEKKYRKSKQYLKSTPFFKPLVKIKIFINKIFLSK